MRAVGHQARRCHQEPQVRVSGVNALPPANRGNAVALADLLQWVSCHGSTLAKPSRRSTPSRESPISCRSTAGSGQDLAVSHAPRKLNVYDIDCDRLQFAPERHGYGHLLDWVQLTLGTCSGRPLRARSPSAAGAPTNRVAIRGFRHAAIERAPRLAPWRKRDAAHNGSQWQWPTVNWRPHRRQCLSCSLPSRMPGGPTDIQRAGTSKDLAKIRTPNELGRPSPALLTRADVAALPHLSISSVRRVEGDLLHPIAGARRVAPATRVRRAAAPRSGPWEERAQTRREERRGGDSIGRSARGSRGGPDPPPRAARRRGPCRCRPRSRHGRRLRGGRGNRYPKPALDRHRNHVAGCDGAQARAAVIREVGASLRPLP